MIIFYNKQTGDIKGTVNGRVHDEGHLKMWVGDKEETDRLVVQWKPADTVVLDDGREAVVWHPDVDQKEQFDFHIALDRGEVRIKDFKVDVITKNLVPIQV